MLCWLIVLAKIPDIRPVGIGDIWRHLLAKCSLCVTREEGKIACIIDQLCDGMYMDIEAGIHVMCMQWDTKITLEDQGFLLVDAKNAFNSQNRAMML